MDNLNIFTRNFSNSEEDFEFTYEILKKRLSNKKSIIKYITNKTIPTYEQHKENLVKNFKKLIICFANDIKIGFCTIDNNNYVGYFYDNRGLKKASKIYPELIRMDLSNTFFHALVNTQPKGTVLYANISSENSIANKTASRFMQHIGNIYAYEVE